MADEFSELKIDGAVIREIVFVPAGSVRMSVLRAPETTDERQVTVQRTLSFQGIHGCAFNFDAKPWLEIASHGILSASQYLSEFSDTKSDVFHFQLVLDEGRVDIVAEQFSSSIEEEIPHLGSAEVDT